MFEKIKEVFRDDLGIEDEIAMESDLRDDLEIDSMAAGELALQLDERYGVDLDKDELAGLVTVGDLVQLLEEKGLE